MNVDFTSAETTAVINWIETDERRYQHWRDLTRRALTSSGRVGALPKISDALYDAVAKSLPMAEGLAGDLMPRLLVRVNFYEIANALVRDVEETPVAANAA